MGEVVKDQQLHPCDSLLLELNVIWDEVGEPDTVRDKTLLELEQKCLDVYKRKVDQANRSRAKLRQSIAKAEAEDGLARICSAIGELPVHVRQSVFLRLRCIVGMRNSIFGSLRDQHESQRHMESSCAREGILCIVIVLFSDLSGS